MRRCDLRRPLGVRSDESGHQLLLPLEGGGLKLHEAPDDGHRGSDALLSPTMRVILVLFVLAGLWSLVDCLVHGTSGL